MCFNTKDKSPVLMQIVLLTRFWIFEVLFSQKTSTIEFSYIISDSLLILCEIKFYAIKA